MLEFGRYRLLEPIGSGGMAKVWRAELPGPEGFVKEVALKLIRPESEARPESVRMFVQEARLASRLTHANIVQVFDFGQCHGRYYLAMERVRGRTLREVVDRCRGLGLRLGVRRTVHTCAEVARALAYAHGQEEGRPAGVVHRDVSPQNVLVSFEGEVKLTDFGIARALGAPDLTAPGTLKGKAAYMAPEQARGEAVDGRADVFAVGVILWELCAGRRLFARESEAATLSALLSEKVPSPPSAWNEEVPPELDRLVAGALERDPSRRTNSAEELAQALAELRLRLAGDPSDLDLRALMRRLWPDGPDPVRRKGQTLVRAAATPRPPPTATPSTLTLARKTAARIVAWLGRPRPRAIRAAVALVAMAAAGTAGTVAWHARRGSTRAPRSSPVTNPLPGPSTPAALTANAPSRSAPGTGDGVPGIDARRHRLDVLSVQHARTLASATPAVRAPPGRAKRMDPFLHAEVLDPSVKPGAPDNAQTQAG